MIARGAEAAERALPAIRQVLRERIGSAARAESATDLAATAK